MIRKTQMCSTLSKEADFKRTIILAGSEHFVKRKAKVQGKEVTSGKDTIFFFGGCGVSNQMSYINEIPWG